ncbi:hypothetical protein LTS18_010767, partial [Coniosporium uncinatum]
MTSQTEHSIYEQMEQDFKLQQQRHTTAQGLKGDKPSTLASEEALIAQLEVKRALITQFER